MIYSQIVKNNNIMKFNIVSVILTLSLLQTIQSNFSAFGQGNSNNNYTLDLIKQFTPNANNNEIKCQKIDGIGYPIKILEKFNNNLKGLFNPADPNIFVRMFYYKEDFVNKERFYKYGIEIRSFVERVYIVIKLVIKDGGSSDSPEEMFFMTKNAQLLPGALQAKKLDLGNVLGCGDLKTLFNKSTGK